MKTRIVDEPAGQFGRFGRILQRVTLIPEKGRFIVICEDTDCWLHTGQDEETMDHARICASTHVTVTSGHEVHIEDSADSPA